MTARTLIKHEGGATAVEFALIAVPLIALMFGTIEFGRLIWAYQGVEETTRETARCVGIVQSQCSENNEFSETQSRNFAQASARGWGLALDDEAVGIDRLATCDGLDGFSRITISYAFNSPVPGFNELLGDARLIDAVACFPNQI